MKEHDPIDRFQGALARMRSASTLAEPDAAALATADASGRPSVRIVLLRAVDSRGFVFYTNRESRKARDLEANPHAALCFHWPAQGEQVRIEGTVERVGDDECDAYFAGRPRGSQLGAWASRQSEELGSREELQAAVAEAERRFAGRDVPRPPFWGGYRIVPTAIEFWKQGDDRLHDRERYERALGGWRSCRLFP